MVSEDRWSLMTGRINMILKRLFHTNAEIYVFLVKLPRSYYTGSTVQSMANTQSGNITRQSLLGLLSWYFVMCSNRIERSDTKSDLTYIVGTRIWKYVLMRGMRVGGGEGGGGWGWGCGWGWVGVWVVSWVGGLGWGWGGEFSEVLVLSRYFDRFF